VIAVLGLGEAGSAIGSDIAAAGAEVRGWDVRDDATATGVQRAADAGDAVAGCDVVLSVNAATAACDAAHSVAGSLNAGQVFADLNSSGAQLKRDVAGVVEPTGALFADVALMAPVPGRGVRTPALVSGPGAQRFAELLGPLGMPVEVVGSEPGDAARFKLLRSVFMKGLAATIIEALAAARAAGCEDWLFEEIVTELARTDAAAVTRLVSRSSHHAARRVHEVADAAALLRELGVSPRVTEAAGGWLEELRDA
jgi:3-hydroxyisobutyrate dehydrogenase-like beta-hydroxyacid dehydrogenase